jgi:predicted outer membrane repeat protein
MSYVALCDNTSLTEGGGLYTRGAATLTNVDIEDNKATDPLNGKGGGIYVRLGTTTLVTGCTVFDNTAAVPLNADPNLASNIIWALAAPNLPGGVIIPNIADNTINPDTIDFDANPR